MKGVCPHTLPSQNSEDTPPPLRCTVGLQSLSPDTLPSYDNKNQINVTKNLYLLLYLVQRFTGKEWGIERERERDRAKNKSLLQRQILTDHQVSLLSPLYTISSLFGPFRLFLLLLVLLASCIHHCWPLSSLLQSWTSQKLRPGWEKDFNMIIISGVCHPFCSFVTKL